MGTIQTGKENMEAAAGQSRHDRIEAAVNGSDVVKNGGIKAGEKLNECFNNVCGIKEPKFDINKYGAKLEGEVLTQLRQDMRDVIDARNDGKALPIDSLNRLVDARSKFDSEQELKLISDDTSTRNGSTHLSDVLVGITEDIDKGRGGAYGVTGNFMEGFKTTEEAPQQLVEFKL